MERPDPTADDDPAVAGEPVAPGRTSFPAGPRELGGVLREKQGPDSLVEPVEGLPRDARSTSARELAEAVVEGERTGMRQVGHGVRPTL